MIGGTRRSFLPPRLGRPLGDCPAGNQRGDGRGEGHRRNDADASDERTHDLDGDDLAARDDERILAARREQDQERQGGPDALERRERRKRIAGEREQRSQDERREGPRDGGERRRPRTLGQEDRGQRDERACADGRRRGSSRPGGVATIARPPRASAPVRSGGCRASRRRA
jgi:hypothetical protein